MITKDNVTVCKNTPVDFHDRHEYTLLYFFNQISELQLVKTWTSDFRSTFYIVGSDQIPTEFHWSGGSYIMTYE